MVFLILPPCEKNSWLAYSNKSCFASLILISLTYHLRYRRAEFWLENRLMLEFMPPEFVAEYLQLMQPHIAQQVFGQPIETALD
jgi:hypothetical protein